MRLFVTVSGCSTSSKNSFLRLKCVLRRSEKSTCSSGEKYFFDFFMNKACRLSSLLHETLFPLTFLSIILETLHLFCCDSTRLDALRTNEKVKQNQLIIYCPSLFKEPVYDFGSCWRRHFHFFSEINVHKGNKEEQAHCRGGGRQENDEQQESCQINETKHKKRSLFIVSIIKKFMIQLERYDSAQQ